MKEIKEFEQHLNNIVKPVLKDDNDDLDTMDLDLDNVGAELDSDDDDGKSYAQAPMYDQLGKVLDSRGNPKPVTHVTTDDGKKHKVNPDQARTIRMLMTTDKVKPMVRTQFQRDMQTSNALVDFLDHDYHELPSLFVKRYLS